MQLEHRLVVHGLVAPVFDPGGALVVALAMGRNNK